MLNNVNVFKAGESIEQIIEHEDPVDTVAHEPEPKYVKYLLCS